jgi:hypothetical protein
MQLFIKKFNNKHLCLNCDQNMTYEELKIIISGKIQIPFQKFQIMKEGKYLESKFSQKTLIIQMNIVKNCTLILKEILFPIIKIKN